MIKRIYDDSPLKYFSNCPLSLRAVSLSGAYGYCCEQAKLWVQENGSVPTALICDFYSDATLVTLVNADFEELTSFLRFSRYESLTLSCADAEKLGLSCNEFNLMCFKREIEHDTAFKSGATLLDASADMKLYRDIYLLEEMSVPFEVWYADLALRVAKGYASGAVLYRNSSIVSAALVPNMCAYGAMISGVKTKEGQQGKGYASECIQYLINTLAKDLYLFCNDALVPFYEGLGFGSVGKISIAKEKKEKNV